MIVEHANVLTDFFKSLGLDGRSLLQALLVYLASRVGTQHGTVKGVQEVAKNGNPVILAPKHK